MTPESSSVTPQVRAEAAAWVARLHGSARSPNLEAGFRRWLSGSVANAKAFELATEAWESGGAVPPHALMRLDRRSGARVSRYRSWTTVILSKSNLAWAAMVSLLAVGTLIVHEHELHVRSTAVGEQRTLNLDDGTHISLNTATRLYVRYNAAQRLVELSEGEAMFDVARNPQRPFVVHVGDREVIALGTAFDVRRDSHRVSITLVEGKVQVSPQGTIGLLEVGSSQLGAVEVLAPGQRVTFTDGNPGELDRPPMEKVTAWRRGEVVLDKTRLGEAVQELNRYSVKKLIIEEPTTADIRVSGVFRVGDSLRFARAVAETYGLHLHQQGSQLVIGR